MSLRLFVAGTLQLSDARNAVDVVIYREWIAW
jgi:hypothetical protein